MRYLPIHIDLEGQKLLVIGGAGAAEAKLRSVLKTPADIHVISPEPSAEIIRWAEQGRLILHERVFVPADMQGARLVYVATENTQKNTDIARLAREQGILVNTADQKADCDFITPALVDRSPVTMSIGTEGTSPALARALKADLESRLPATLGRLARKTAELRKAVAAKLEHVAERQRFWADIFGARDLQAHLKLSESELEARVQAKLDGTETDALGHVYLVGAGPGDAGLLTLAAQRLLYRADVIVYDRLVSQEVLDFGRREADYIYVGKEPGGRSTPQNEINAILLEKARAGLQVVRLKGGDPLIFGRADEELDALQDAGLGYTIVPGITSAAAAAAEIGASLTTRGHNKAVALLTGHDAKGFAEQDWKGLAQEGARAAVYMGVGAARFIQGRLMLHGARSDLPVTIVENASRENQIVVESTLGNLPQDIESKGIKGPAILLLGYAPRKAHGELDNLLKEAQS